MPELAHEQYIGMQRRLYVERFASNLRKESVTASECCTWSDDRWAAFARFCGMRRPSLETAIEVLMELEEHPE